MIDDLLALPIHPAVVHFPIALLSLAWVCTVARYGTGDLRWDGRSRLFEIPGVLALIPTIAAGFVDTRGIGFLANPRLDGPLFWHFVAAITAATAFTVHVLWRRRRPAGSIVGRAIVGDVGLATLGMLALIAAGSIGAEMVYAT